VSDRTWEYVPDTASVVGGLTSEQIVEVEALAARLADAAGVRRIGTPLDLQEAVSGLKSYGEGSLLIWFLEDYREDIVLVVRVQHFGVIEARCFGRGVGPAHEWLAASGYWGTQRARGLQADGDSAEKIPLTC
jgi:hypothetical protein